EIAHHDGGDAAPNTKAECTTGSTDEDAGQVDDRRKPDSELISWVSVPCVLGNMVNAVLFHGHACGGRALLGHDPTSLSGTNSRAGTLQKVGDSFPKNRYDERAEIQWAVRSNTRRGRRDVGRGVS